MAKKVIQVPVDEQLLKDLDDLSRKQGKARSQLIRQACLSYLRQIEHEELENVYRQGYLRIPEEPATGETQIAMAGEIMSRETW